VHAWDGDGFRTVHEDVVFANYPAFAPDGTLFVSDSGTWRRNDGRILRIGADGGVETFSRDAPNFTNGLAVSPDGGWLWVAESFEPNVSRIELASGRCELVVRLDDGTVPDGLAFTSDGGVLISCYRPDRVYHLDAAGSLEVVADDPRGTILGAPTNVCFARPELDLIVVANLGRWHLTAVEAGLGGAPLHAPERWAVDA
jgi:gluconolactonase